jgi:serine/threonine protein kinase
MSDIRADSHAGSDPIEELVFLYLEEREEGLVTGYDEFARRHPSSSAAVRERIVALERAGLMNDPGPEDFPERLGNFRLLERLGGGGMGIVFVAEEVSLGRRVALKLIRPEQIYLPQAKERFRREVEAIAKLSHPGLVQVFSFSEDGGVPYFAMELVEGASLGDLLRHFAGTDPGALSGVELKSALESISGKSCSDAALFHGPWPRACLEIARQVALALEHAHQRGVVHRDIKPSNIMLTLDGRARLLDFGLASRSGATRLTRSGAQLGSLPYMPPELVSGRLENAAATSDVYSLGVALHESLSLKLPFGGDSAAEVALNISSGTHESLRRRNPEVSLDIETICNVAMELEPQRRYASAGALAADLASVLERRPIAARPTSRWVRAKRWVQRNPAGAASAALSALLLVGGPTGYGLLQARAASKQHELNEELKQANLTVRAANC